MHDVYCPIQLQTRRKNGCQKYEITHKPINLRKYCFLYVSICSKEKKWITKRIAPYIHRGLSRERYWNIPSKAWEWQNKLSVSTREFSKAAMIPKNAGNRSCLWAGLEENCCAAPHTGIIHIYIYIYIYISRKRRVSVNTNLFVGLARDIRYNSTWRWI